MFLTTIDPFTILDKDSETAPTDAPAMGDQTYAFSRRCFKLLAAPRLDTVQNSTD